MDAANSARAFRRATARFAVLWAILCMGLSAVSFLGLALRPSHRIITTAVTGGYMILSPDELAREAGVRRGDRLLSVNGQSLDQRPLAQVPVRTDDLNTYELRHPPGGLYRVRLSHRRLGFVALLGSPFTYLFLLLLLIPCIYLGLGIGVYRARPELDSSWALLLLSSFVAAYVSGVFHPGWRVPGFGLAIGFSASVMLVPALHLCMLYPIELDFVRRRRRLLLVPYVVALAFFLFYAATYVGGWGHARAIRTLLYWNLFVIGLAGAYMLLARRLMPTRDLRDRLDIALLGYAVSALPVGATLLLQNRLETAFPAMLALGWFVLFPLLIGLGIVRQRIIGIRDVARSSFVYGLLTVAITGSYALAVALAGTLFGTRYLENPWVSFPVIFGLVVLFSPLREQLHSVAGRLFDRDRAHYQEAVRTVSDALGSLLSVDEIVERVLWAVTGPMGAGTASVLLLDRDRPAYRVVAVRGEKEPGDWSLEPDHPLVKLVGSQRVGMSWEELPEQVLPEALERCRSVYEDLGASLLVPLVFGVDLHGVLAVGKKRTGDPVELEDRETLRTLTNQAAVAIVNARAYEEIARLNQTLEARIEARTRELRETQAVLSHREKMAALGQLVAGVAHEINNPISFVHANLQLIGEQLDRLLSAVDSNEPDRAGEARGHVKKLLERGQEGTRRIREIVSALETFSQVDRTDVDLHDLGEGFETTLELVGSTLGEVELVQEFHPAPPVRCNAGQINQVLMNLLLNARDAGALRIAIRIGIDGDSVWFDVQDDGCGIPQENQTRIFEPFFTTKGVGQGTGLGLAISHGIVQWHGGRIEVRSTGGDGTTIRVVLPIKGPEEPLERGPQVPS
ncbi:MAG: ATP-binding protein [Myxococcota bacterium]